MAGLDFFRFHISYMTSYRMDSNGLFSTGNLFISFYISRLSIDVSKQIYKIY